MAKKISLELQIGGVKQSVSSINDLDKAIQKMKDDLKGLDIGSSEFQRLSGEIRKAQNFAEDLNETLKPQELEKRVGSYAKVGSAIVSSFAAAQAAIGLFGQESEDVARAAAKAQQILTIALTAREVAEGAVALKTVAANIATAASAAAANTANVATKALYTTIAANPYGALLAAIGAVVGAVIYFTGETEKQVDAVKEATAVVSQESTVLASQLVILQSLNTGNEIRVQTIEKLKKEYPGFNAFIDEENRLTEDGVRFLELKIKQLVIEARTKAIVNRINAESQKILELQNKDVLGSITLWDRLVNSLESVGRIGNPLPETEALQKQNKEIQQSETNIIRLGEALLKENQELDKVLIQQKDYNETLKRTNDEEQKAVKNKTSLAEQQKQITAAYQKGLTATIDLSDAVKQLNSSLLNYEQTLEKLSNLSYEAPILDTLKKVKEARVQAAKELQTSVQQVQSTLKTFVVPTNLQTDPLINIFKVLREQLEEEFGKLGTSQFKGFQDIFDRLVRQNISLTQEQKGFLTDVVQGYEDLAKVINEAPGFTEYIRGLKGINVEWDNFRTNAAQGLDPVYSGAQALAAIIGEITASNKQFFLEFKQEAPGLSSVLNQISDDINMIEPIQFDPVKAKANAEKYVKDLENSLFKPVAVKLLTLELQAQQAALKTVTDPVRKGEIEGFIKNITQQIEVVNKTGQFAANLTKTTGEEVRKEVTLISTGFLKLAGAVVTAEQKILLVNNEFNKLKQSLKPEELSQAIGGTVLANIDTISTLLIGARTKEQKIEKDFIEKLKKDRQGLENFKLQLIQAGVDVEKASYEDLLQAYIAYKKKEAEVDKNTEKQKKDGFTQTLNDVQRGIQTFQQYLGEAGSLVNARIQTDMESLRIAEKQNLDMVVGETESAAKKRLEIQAEYEARRKELEKKARISSLQFSLVQAIANAAQGITRTIAEFGFPIAAPLIAIQAGLTAAELAIIGDQISNAQSMRRGGLIKAQGGMLLSGPSHENGGIPLAQMGVIAEGQEAIINRNSLINYRDLLSSVNQAGGGRPLVVNNFDDSRIVEAIASQRQKPLRAYVLQSEITNEQALSKRLDDLSKI